MPAPRVTALAAMTRWRMPIEAMKSTPVMSMTTFPREPATADTAGTAGTAGAVENYILRKARVVAGALPPGELKERLAAAAVSYEEALAAAEASPEDVDPAEEELLELTWVLAEFIALGKVIYVLGIQHGGHAHV